MVIINNAVDTIGLFYIMFFFIAFVVLLRNSTFQSKAKELFKTISNSLNTLPLLSYISFFFKNFLKTNSHLVNSFFLFFKKK